MGFTPIRVGLGGQTITARFNEYRRRKKCYHPGIDISSSRKAMPYSAGVWGTVNRIAPSGPKSYNTITITPFHNSLHQIQYLHSSSVKVKQNSIVAPWTTIGETGDLPPGSSTQIHLHLQVIKLVGKAAHKCWKSGRNFINPELFDTGNPVKGHWRHKNSYTQGNLNIVESRKLTLYNDVVGSRVSMTFTEDIKSGRYHVKITHVFSGVIQNRTGRGFKIDVSRTSCTSKGNISIDCYKRTVRGGVAEVSLKSKNSLKTTSSSGANIDWSKGVPFSNNKTRLQASLIRRKSEAHQSELLDFINQSSAEVLS